MRGPRVTPCPPSLISRLGTLGLAFLVLIGPASVFPNSAHAAPATRADYTPLAVEDVSVNDAGVASNRDAGGVFRGADVSVSDNSRFVLFSSYDARLDPLHVATSTPVYYLRDRLLRTTTLATTTAADGPLNSPVIAARLSGDGRHVAFWTWATNVGVPGQGLYVRNLVTGVVAAVNSASQQFVVSDDGTVFPNASSVSTDGRYEVIPARDGQLYRLDRSTGDQVLVTVNILGGPSNEGGGPSAISADGRFVAFVSSSTDLVPATPDPAGCRCTHIYWRDLASNSTVLILVAGLPSTAGDQYNPSAVSISGDGAEVAFMAGGEGYVWNSMSTTSRMVTQQSGEALGDGPGTDIELSADGTAVAFDANANLGTAVLPWQAWVAPVSPA